MPTELRGRKRRKSKNRKNRHHLRRRKFVSKKDGQEYGQVLQILGYLRVLVFCSDNKERVCHIRGRLRSKEYIRPGDFVLVGLRDYQNYEGDVILKYTPTEIKLLKKRNKLPVPPETDDSPLLLYGQIVNRLSKGRVLAFCIDGKQRVCRVLSKERMERGDIIHVECRDHLGAMNILLENDKKKAEASSPESPTATTSKKMSSLNEDIMEQLLKNQILKHELLLKKCRLADLQIEYITRQLRRGFQE